MKDIKSNFYNAHEENVYTSSNAKFVATNKNSFNVILMPIILHKTAQNPWREWLKNGYSTEKSNLERLISSVHHAILYEAKLDQYYVLWGALFWSHTSILDQYPLHWTETLQYATKQ